MNDIDLLSMNVFIHYLLINLIEKCVLSVNLYLFFLLILSHMNPPHKILKLFNELADN